MSITTKGLIDILPFEDEFRAKLHQQWDSLTPDQRNNIAQMLWNTYADIYQARFDTNVDISLLEIADGKKIPLNRNFAKYVGDQTVKEMRQQVNSAVTAATLTQTREALQHILNQPPEQKKS